MSSIIKCGPSPSKLAFWVDWKMADIISPLPGCSKHVAKYFQKVSKSGNKPQFRAGTVIAKTAAATGVSKNSVRKTVYAGKVIDEPKTRKAKVRLESWITLMLVSAEESFIICIGRIFLPV